jgi:hypothetical protein
MQAFDLFDDLTHHTRTRLFADSQQISRVNLRNRKNPAFVNRRLYEATLNR